MHTPSVQPRPARSVGVLVVDDQPIFREGLRALLERTEFVVVGDTGDGREAVRLARTLAPGVVSINVSMPGLNGVDATRQIVAESTAVKVMGLSQKRDHRLVTEMLGAGASGYVLKTETFASYPTALRTVAQGKTYLSPALADTLVRDYVGSQKRGRGPLSIREREVLQLIAEGLPTSEVARRLHISTKTVDTHRRQIMEKLEARSIAALTKYAIREGLTTLD
jgi:DNA-binding NarL/FixJ family response regulator